MVTLGGWALVLSHKALAPGQGMGGRPPVFPGSSLTPSTFTVGVAHSGKGPDRQQAGGSELAPVPWHLEPQNLTAVGRSPSAVHKPQLHTDLCPFDLSGPHLHLPPTLCFLCSIDRPLLTIGCPYFSLPYRLGSPSQSVPHTAD